MNGQQSLPITPRWEAAGQAKQAWMLSWIFRRGAPLLPPPTAPLTVGFWLQSCRNPENSSQECIPGLQTLRGPKTQVERQNPRVNENESLKTFHPDLMDILKYTTFLLRVPKYHLKWKAEPWNDLPLTFLAHAPTAHKNSSPLCKRINSGTNDLIKEEISGTSYEEIHHAMKRC